MNNHLSEKLKALYLLFAFMLFGTAYSMAYNKHALLVGISDYGNPRRLQGNFSNINGTSDLQILSPELRKQGFKITELKDSKATHAAIISELNKLISRCKAGDIVYLQFSTHGQLVEDLDGDEPDGWDEAIIPVDAQLTYKKGVYEGQNHLIDDELSKYVNQIRKKLGPSGYLYVVLDACHSGTGSRDGDMEDVIGLNNDGPAVRGAVPFTRSGKRYQPNRTLHSNDYFRLKKEKGKSPVIFMEACRSYETNTEIAVNRNCYGPLTYHIVKTIKKQKINKDGKWVDNVKRSFENDPQLKNRLTANKQHMVIEKSE